MSLWPVETCGRRLPLALRQVCRTQATTDRQGSSMVMVRRPLDTSRRMDWSSLPSRPKRRCRSPGTLCPLVAYGRVFFCFKFLRTTEHLEHNQRFRHFYPCTNLHTKSYTPMQSWNYLRPGELITGGVPLVEWIPAFFHSGKQSVENGTFDPR